MLLLCCAQLCPTLFNPMDCSPAGSSVHGISQARILEWAAISCCRGSFQPRNQTHVSFVSYIDRFFTSVPPGKHIYIYIYICNLIHIATFEEVKLKMVE